MMRKPPAGRPTLNDIKGLLARTPVIRGACELDVLGFLHRHPRSLLTNEQLAAFAGYDNKQVAGAIEAFIVAGLLERTQNPAHAARMYCFLPQGPHGGGLRQLLQLAATRQGRRNILEVLGAGPTRTSPAAIGETKLELRKKSDAWKTEKRHA